MILETHIVPSEIEPERMQEYAAGKFAAIPTRKGIKKAIKRGRLLCNGKVVGTGHWVRPGEVIELTVDKGQPPKPYPMKLNVHFEDDCLAVIKKPAGITVSGNQHRTVQNAIMENLQPSGAFDKLPWPQPVHRLDYGTSGLLLVAKSKGAQVGLGEMLAHRKILKSYHAVVVGKTATEGSISTPIDGKTALTFFTRKTIRVSHHYQFLSLLELNPVTGRRYQLRVHLSGAGHPILGDREYGKPGWAMKGKGMFLAAVRLEFTHPVDGQSVCVEMKTPKKFERVMAYEERKTNYLKALNSGLNF